LHAGGGVVVASRITVKGGITCGGIVTSSGERSRVTKHGHVPNSGVVIARAVLKGSTPISGIIDTGRILLKRVAAGRRIIRAEGILQERKRSIGGIK